MQECAKDLYNLIKELYPGRSLEEIVKLSGAELMYEKPPSKDRYQRHSEYREKTKTIVIFTKEHKDEAIAHELFHHLENITGSMLSRKESEEQAKIFAKLI